MPELFGIEHILYIIISTLILGGGLVFAFVFVKNDKIRNGAQSRHQGRGVIWFEGPFGRRFGNGPWIFH